MQWCRFISMVALVFLFAVAAPAGAAEEDEFETVTMILVGGDMCVAVDKPTATIFRNKNPMKVKWAVTVPGKYWEIRYQESSPEDPDKPTGQGDYFNNSGRLDINCAQKAVRTVVPDKQIPEGAQWPYKIVVYDCAGSQQKGEKLCELDPNVDWGD